MRRKKRNQGSNVKGTLVGFLLMFCIIAVLFGWVYKIGVNRPPLKYALIPESTLDYLRNLNKINPGQGINLTDEGPFNWDNDEDYGQSATGDMEWKSEENENFIIYYHKDKDALWQGYAQQMLEDASAAIPSMIDLMGRYYYPEDMNGRKLAIYLAESEKVYNSTINHLMGQNAGSHSGSLGITIFSIGRTGCMTDGIVLHPKCFEDDPHGLNGYYKVLLHEMNHYVFFSSLDYEREIDHRLWVSEGLAEYYCNPHEQQVQGSDSISFIDSKCDLSKEFPLDKNSAYWAGESFYRFVEQTKGVEAVKSFLQNAYQYSTDSTLIVSKLPAKQTKQKWVRSLIEQPIVTDSVAASPDMTPEQN